MTSCALPCSTCCNTWCNWQSTYEPESADPCACTPQRRAVDLQASQLPKAMLCLAAAGRQGVQHLLLAADV